jgi:hypothetical protein
MTDTPRCDSLHTLEVMQWKPLAEDLERQLTAARIALADVTQALDECDLRPHGSLADRIRTLTQHHREWKSMYAELANKHAELAPYAVASREALVKLHKAVGEFTMYANDYSAVSFGKPEVLRAWHDMGAAFDDTIEIADECEFEIGQSPTIAALKEANDGKCDHGVSLEEPCGACDEEERPTPAMVAAKTMHAELRASVATGTVCGTSIPIVSSGPEGDKAYLHSPQVGVHPAVALLAEWLDTEIDPEDEEYAPWMDSFTARVKAAIAGECPAIDSQPDCKCPRAAKECRGMRLPTERCRMLEPTSLSR